MEMTRRGFLKFLGSLPAVALVATAPTLLAAVLEPEAERLEFDVDSNLLLGFSDGTLVPVLNLIPSMQEPEPVALVGGATLYAPARTTVKIRFDTGLRSAMYLRNQMDRAFHVSSRQLQDCIVYARAGTKLEPIAKLFSLYVSDISAMLMSEYQTVSVEITASSSIAVPSL